MGERLAVPEDVGEVRRAGGDEGFGDAVDLAEVKRGLFRLSISTGTGSDMGILRTSNGVFQAFCWKMLDPTQDA